jgi:addiction module HigA family antidote
MKKVEHLFRRPTSPGDILRYEILEENNITQDELADAIGMSRLTVNQIINGKRSVTAETALKLAVATNLTPEFWLNLQMNLDLYDAREKLGEKFHEIKVVMKTPIRSKIFHSLSESKKARRR